jgi:hypothetical protein
VVLLKVTFAPASERIVLPLLGSNQGALGTLGLVRAAGRADTFFAMETTP